MSRAGRRFTGTAVPRRRALRVLGLTVAATCAGGAFAEAPPRSDPPKSGDDGDALDLALGRVHRCEPECKQGLSTHAPMGAEALCALGFGERAVEWVDSIDAPVLRLPGRSAPIDRDRWREALGPVIGATSWEKANARWADWTDLFARELDERPWTDVLDTWVARLAPGMSGAATHGVIRTAHAVRALAARNSPPRRAELARGLAYWASSYEELPARPRDARRFDAFAEALAEVPLYREAFGRAPDGRNIVEVLRHVRELDRFAEVRDLLVAPDDLARGLSALTATFSRVYLRHGTAHDTIAFVHAVTGPASLRRMAPFVREGTARAAFPYAWQTAAAIFSAYARDRALGRVDETRTALAPEELAARAVANGDAHAIKFTEVMLAEHRISRDPVYLAAADHAAREL